MGQVNNCCGACAAMTTRISSVMTKPSQPSNRYSARTAGYAPPVPADFPGTNWHTTENAVTVSHAMLQEKVPRAAFAFGF